MSSLARVIAGSRPARARARAAAQRVAPARGRRPLGRRSIPTGGTGLAPRGRLPPGGPPRMQGSRPTPRRRVARDEGAKLLRQPPPPRTNASRLRRAGQWDVSKLTRPPATPRLVHRPGPSLWRPHSVVGTTPVSGAAARAVSQVADDRPCVDR